MQIFLEVKQKYSVFLQSSDTMAHLSVLAEQLWYLTGVRVNAQDLCSITDVIHVVQEKENGYYVLLMFLALLLKH